MNECVLEVCVFMRVFSMLDMRAVGGQVTQVRQLVGVARMYLEW